MALSLNEIMETAQAGETKNIELTISNNGPGPMDYSIGTNMFSGKRDNKDMAAVDKTPLGYRLAETDKNPVK